MSPKYTHYYDTAFSRLQVLEGGFQDDPRDRGNWTSGQVGIGELKGTNCGIAAMTYPDLDIKNLTEEDIKYLYWRDFWNPVVCDSLPPELTYQLLDASVHHGIGNASKMVQRAVGVKDDGIIGPITKAAIRDADIHDLLKYFLAERLEFMVNVTSWPTYSRGWSRRIAKNLRHAANDT